DLGWGGSEKARIGKTPLNTSCSPTLARCSGTASICKKWSYELRCTSIKLGIGATSGMRPKVLRIRFWPEKDIAIYVPRCGPRPDRGGTRSKFNCRRHAARGQKRRPRRAVGGP